MENYKNHSMVDVAYEVLSEHNGEIKFKDLFDKVCELQEISDEEAREVISKFFTNLSLDERFVILKNNEWDLRSRQTYDRVHIDMNEIYEEIDENDEQGDDSDLDEDERLLSGDDEEENEEETPSSNLDYGE